MVVFEFDGDRIMKDDITLLQFFVPDYSFMTHPIYVFVHKCKAIPPFFDFLTSVTRRYQVFRFSVVFLKKRQSHRPVEGPAADHPEAYYATSAHTC